MSQQVYKYQEFFFPDGDLTIKVQDSLFRIHRHFLTRESRHFKSMMIPVIPCKDPPGSSDTNPVVLQDATSEGFAGLLWVFYNREYSIYKAPLEKWKDILTLAQKWGFVQVEKLCERELEKLPLEELPHVEKIQLYQHYNITRSLLHGSFVELTTRPEPLGVEEGDKLGLETSLRIARARELARARDRTLQESEVQSVIEEVFGLRGSRPPPTTAPPKEKPTTDDNADKGAKFRNNYKNNSALSERKVSSVITHGGKTPPQTRRSRPFIGLGAMSPTFCLVVFFISYFHW